jgi:tRNA A37 N6-isopentenylltransferase MiaA
MDLRRHSKDEWRKLFNEELHNKYSSLNNVKSDEIKYNETRRIYKGSGVTIFGQKIPEHELEILNKFNIKICTVNHVVKK